MEEFLRKAKHQLEEGVGAVDNRKEEIRLAAAL